MVGNMGGRYLSSTAVWALQGSHVSLQPLCPLVAPGLLRRGTARTAVTLPCVSKKASKRTSPVGPTPEPSWADPLLCSVDDAGWQADLSSVCVVLLSGLRALQMTTAPGARRPTCTGTCLAPCCAPRDPRLVSWQRGSIITRHTPAVKSARLRRPRLPLRCSIDQRHKRHTSSEQMHRSQQQQRQMPGKQPSWHGLLSRPALRLQTRPQTTRGRETRTRQLHPGPLSETCASGTSRWSRIS